MSKTNAQHLRDIIETSNLTPRKYEEAIEFIEAMEEEITDMSYGIKAHQESYISLEREKDELEENIDEFELQDEGLTTTDLGYGTIEWRTDNLKLQMYMESLSERLETIGV